MASRLESEAALHAELRQRNLAFLIERFEEAGWKTLGQLAYATSYVPGNPDDTKLREDIFDKLVKPTDEKPDGIRAHLRRLFFEAHTLAVHETRAQIDRTMRPDGPRKLDGYERDARRAAFLKANQRGAFYWSDDRMASDDLIDLVVEQFEERELRWIPWDQRTSQKFMLDNEPRPAKRRPDPDFITQGGYLKAVTKEDRPVCPLNENMHEFTFLWERMMDRMGMALEIGQIMSYTKHELLVNYLLDRKRKKPNSDEFLPVS